MRSIIRLVAAGAVALPLLIGAAGVAAAEEVEYDHTSTSASAEGAAVYTLASGADDDGNTYYYELMLGAGPYGAGVAETGAWTHGDDSGFFENYAFSSNEGAFTSDTESHADGDDDWDDDWDDDDHHDDDHDYDD